MSRSTDEWIGKNDDAKVPAHVKLRIFNRAGGICHISGRKIMPSDTWEVEHVLALCLGGEHREGNLAPALTQPHKVKTAQDVAQKAKNDRVRKIHLGIKKPSKFACSRSSKFKKRVDGSVVLR